MNFNNYKEMREYIFTNLQLDGDVMELVFALKKGRINNLKFLNEDCSLLSSKTKLFGGSEKISEIVCAMLGMVLQDPSSQFK